MGYLHDNVPGVLAGDQPGCSPTHGANVVGAVARPPAASSGYVVTDTDVAPSDAALAALRQSPQTVWLRSWRG